MKKNKKKSWQTKLNSNTKEIKEKLTRNMCITKVSEKEVLRKEKNIQRIHDQTYHNFH